MIAYELYFYNRSGGGVRLAYKSNEPDDYPIFSLKYKIEVNKTGSCTFVVSTAHPLYDSVSEMNTYVYVVVRYIKNGVVQHKYCPFVGRVIEVNEDEMDNKECTCEGRYGTLNDTFLRVRTVIGNVNQFRTKRYVSDVLSNAFAHHYTYHTEDYGVSTILGNIFSPVTDRLNNVENVTYEPNSGPLICNYDNEDDIYKDDSSVKSLFEMVFNIALKKGGGFFLPVYDPFDGNSISLPKCLWTYNSYKLEDYGGSNLHTLINYPNESYPDIEDPFLRWTWLPNFTRGQNIVTMSKESSIKTKFNTVIPIGKDNLLITGNTDDNPYPGLISVSSYVDSPYYPKLPIVVNFEDVSYSEDLRNSGIDWINVHIRDADLPPKYTITGPEPCGVGCGDKLIMLMRDVIVREDPSEELVNSTMLPCLSMEIDVENPQSNVYVIGPFIDDDYSETNISSK